MCDYCKKIYEHEYHVDGDDGICRCKVSAGYILYIEHYNGEVTRLPINNCPKCGRKLDEGVDAYEP